MGSAIDNEAKSSAISKQIKIASTLLMLGAIALYIWQRLAPLPSVLRPVFLVAQVAAIIHAIEGAIAAILIYRYRFSPERAAGEGAANPSASLLIDHLPDNTPRAILKAGLYAFFVGTIGLVEIIKATRSVPAAQTPN